MFFNFLMIEEDLENIENYEGKIFNILNLKLVVFGFWKRWFRRNKYVYGLRLLWVFIYRVRLSVICEFEEGVFLMLK